MSAPDPEGMSLLAKVIAAGSAVAAPIGWLYSKLDKKADKNSVANSFQEIKAESAIHRAHIGKLFDKLEEHARQDSEQFNKLLEKMGDQHAELLTVLGRKQDRK